MSQHRLACLSLLLIAPGCSFDPSPLNGEPGEPPDARPTIDAMPGGDARPDAGQGCQDGALRLALRIGGTAVTDAQPGPYVEALLGDVVEISAADSCGGDGALSYEWAITPDNGILATANTDLAAGPATFTVYPTAAGDYTVALTVRDSAGGSVETSVIAIRAHAWQAATVPAALDMGEARDLAVGGGNLWIAGEGGPFSLPLAGAPDAFARVTVSGDMVPNDLRAVFFDDRTDFLWFGHAGDQAGPWRVEVGTIPPESVQIPWDEPGAIGATAQTRDIVGFGTDTIIVATSKGVTAVDGIEDRFADQIQPGGENPEALATGDGRRMAGARRLYDLPDGPAIDIGVGGSDNKIRAMAIDAFNEELWIGTDGQGVVAFDLRANATLEFYLESNSGLGSNKIQALVVESDGPHAGDVWAATDKGVSRYIRQRETWIHMDAAHGLTGHLDLRALAIDTDQNRRVIYAGSTAGVVYIRKP